MAEIKNLFIEGTAKVPQIDFNQLSGELRLSGKSIPEDASRIYKPIVEWINEYIKSPRLATNLHVNLEYFNSATSIWLAKIVKALSKISKVDCVLIIHLYFDIGDFESMDKEELEDIVFTLVGNISNVKISIGLKTYGTDRNGKIVKDATIFV
jgi:hypothetical protein